MRRIVISAFAVLMTIGCFAQTDSTMHMSVVKKKAAANTGSSDHFVLQLGYLNWTGIPDSIHTKGFPHSFNVYLMLDFPFKTNPHWSVALGPGISTDHMYFNKTFVDIKDAKLRFDDQSDTTHFKKVKLATAYAELPVELRYRFNTEKSGGLKIAIGAKVGTLVNAHVKATDFESKDDKSLNAYTLKESNRRFFNKSRLSVMGRIGVGNYSLFASYSVTPLFKEGEGPLVRPLTIGLTLSGL